jgi:serine/threonine protein kinase
MELSPGSVIADFRLIERVSSGAFTEKWLVQKAGKESERGVLEIVTDSALASILKSKRAKFPRSRHSAHLFCRLCNLRTEPFCFFCEEFQSRSLGDILKERNRLQPGEAVLIFSQLLDSLNAAHSEGVFHLNLTPESVLVDSGGRVKISGFGLGASVLALKQYLAFRTVAARGQSGCTLAAPSPQTRPVVTGNEIDSLYRQISQAEGAKVSSLLQNLGRVSTPSGTDISADYVYVAPEQKENRMPDARSDIYALGIMLFQMVTGVLPKGQRITELRPDAPAALDRIFMKATAAHAVRYPSVMEMVQDLEPLKSQFISKRAQEMPQAATPGAEKPDKRRISATPETESARRVAARRGSSEFRIRRESPEGAQQPAIELKEKAILRSSAKPRLRRILLFVAAAGAVCLALDVIFLLRRGVESPPVEISLSRGEKEEQLKASLAEIEKLAGADNYDFESIIDRLRTLRAQADGTTLIPQIDARIEQLTQKFEADAQKGYNNLMRKFNELIAAERFQEALACLDAYPERFRKSAYWTEKIPAQKQRAIYLGRAKDEFDYASARLEKEAANLKPGEEEVTLERIRAVVDSFVRSYGDTPYSERLTRRFNALVSSSSTRITPSPKGPAKEQVKRTARTAVKFEIWTSPIIPSESVTALAGARDAVLCGTLSGVSRFDGKEWKQVIPEDETGKAYLAKENVTCILASGDTIWFGTAGGLVRQNQGKVSLFQTADGLPADWIVSIASAPAAEEVWVGTPAGAAVFDGVSWRKFTTKDGLADNYINSVLLTRSEVLLGTRCGLSALSRSDIIRRGGQEPVSFKTFTVANGLPSNTVTALCPDSAGVWIGTEDGLCYAQGGISAVSGIMTLTTYTTADGLPSNFITCLTADSSNNVYAGTRSGLAHFDGQKWTTYTKGTGLAADKITVLLVVGNYLYVGTHFGLTRISLAAR